MSLILNNQVVESSVLSHELQLGEQLNQCVHANRRADFGLLLAMLDEDVRSQSQFLLPQHEQETTEVNNAKLRREFQLPDEPALALTSMHDIKKFSQADLVAKQQMSDIHLREALNPQALAFRDDVKHIVTPIINNTSIHCKNRYNAQNDSSIEEASRRLPFNAKEWLSSIQTAIVKAPLVNAYS